MTSPDFRFDPAFGRWLAGYRALQQLPIGFDATVLGLHVPLAAAIALAAKAQPHLFVLGLCGPQGSGKSTMAEVLVQLIAGHGLRAAVLSLDDLYRTRAQRRALAAQIHPLLATRGPPGTHQVELGTDIIAALAERRKVALPRFDKARDDRASCAQWPIVGPLDVLLFEGWCVGARPEPEAALVPPVNALERDEDQNGIWRKHVNAALAGDYAALFARIDMLVMMQAPSFDTVKQWRLEAETKLRTGRGAHMGSQVMSEAEVLRFVQLFERTTRQIEREMPARADIVIELAAQRQVQNWRMSSER